jgi:Cu2+-containing amine oxidase
MAETTHINGTNGVAHTNGNTNGSSAPSHPLGPLSAAEITFSSALIKAIWPADISLHFRVITLSEPRKAELVPYLLAERARETKPSIDRRAFVVYYLRGTVSWFFLWVATLILSHEFLTRILGVTCCKYHNTSYR